MTSLSESPSTEQFTSTGGTSTTTSTATADSTTTSTATADSTLLVHFDDTSNLPTVNSYATTSLCCLKKLTCLFSHNYMLI